MRWLAGGAIHFIDKDSNSDRLTCRILKKKNSKTACLRPVAVGRLGCMVVSGNGGVYCIFRAPVSDRLVVLRFVH